ncbi:MAG: ADP-ribosylglycohydrolase family protein [Promethearchaeota archaeon]
MKLTGKDYYNRVYGGWLGRVIGSQLGAPLELRPFRYINRRYAELNNYVKKITGKEVNDDEIYEIVALVTLEEYGINFTLEQLAQNWRKRIWKKYFTAEKVAIKNLRKGIHPPQTAIQRNPYYDFIGSQMRGDIWGLICPNCPDVAAKYAKVDATISHVGEGVLGEIFIACLVSLSFSKQNPRELIEEVLHRFIPSDSSYYSIVENCLNWAEKYSNWKDTRAKVIDWWKPIRKELKNSTTSARRRVILALPGFHKIHVLPNAGFITLGLIYGNGDFEKSICTTALCGFDTDCNVGNVGTILGVQVGADQIPAKWKDPIRDTFHTYVKGFQETRISKIAERICKIGEQVIKAKC